MPGQKHAEFDLNIAGKAPSWTQEGMWLGVLAESCSARPSGPQRRWARGGLSQHWLLEWLQLRFHFLQISRNKFCCPAPRKGSQDYSAIFPPLKFFHKASRESYPQSTQPMSSSLWDSLDPSHGPGSSLHSLRRPDLDPSAACCWPGGRNVYEGCRATGAEPNRAHPCLGARLKGQIPSLAPQGPHIQPRKPTLSPQRAVGPHTFSLSTSSGGNGWTNILLGEQITPLACMATLFHNIPGTIPKNKPVASEECPHQSAGLRLRSWPRHLLSLVTYKSWADPFTFFKKLKIMLLLNCGVGEDSWESLGLQRDPTCPFWRRSALGVLWKEWCWSWSSSTLATSCEELTHWKRLWCWEGLGTGGEGDDGGWDGWMASPTRWTWVWVNSGSWWWTGRSGMLWFMGSQRVGHGWATE